MMNLKKWYSVLVASFLGASSVLGQEEGNYAPPQKKALEAYSGDWKKAVFGAAKVKVMAEKFTKHLVLLGIHSSGDVRTVSFQNQKTGEWLSLREDEKSQNGIEIVELKIDRDRRKTSVVLSKGGETGIIFPAPEPVNSAPANPPTPTAAPVQQVEPKPTASRPVQTSSKPPRPQLPTDKDLVRDMPVPKKNSNSSGASSQ